MLYNCLSWYKFVNTHLYHSRQLYNIQLYTGQSVCQPVGTSSLARSLDGDTTTPSGRYARLCHAFLVRTDFVGASEKTLEFLSTVSLHHFYDLRQIIIGIQLFSCRLGSFVLPQAICVLWVVLVLGFLPSLLASVIARAVTTSWVLDWGSSQWQQPTAGSTQPAGRLRTYAIDTQNAIEEIE